MPVAQAAYLVSTHSRAKAADKVAVFRHLGFVVSTHSRAKAAEKALKDQLEHIVVSTHSRAKAADDAHSETVRDGVFQHTAARRRLT